ncbi:bifunctional glutamate N-acetyltransferase/amino-acid acetyltransferase ArgJ [Zavarzinella formosa]|uniref:bifunctional glutamate N-acetyltransferase/amino-acid acetyltransferase ArgJ n=1 Tax=Zavarzinella formosa TaxID=360055 RepID=UPI0002D4E115|nr:bifunctional glutamate N-acetyltransferase/amino-acid acetyltransferase ArgJ [Zavarzinella formosa]
MNLPSGYLFAGVHSGLRATEPGRLDLALLVSERPAAAAGVFTQNRVAAAPVHLCRERLPRNDARGFVVCSGNANACTGDQGMADARRMAELAAKAVGCESEQMLVCSTGVIGRLLPMEVMETGIPAVAKHLMPDVASFEAAAKAILTTDTRIKTTLRHVGPHTVAGFAKGAAMIGPNMATMLGFVFTDAAVRPDDLHTILKGAVEETFNCISVEGHMSTNDTVLILANGTGEPLAGAALAEFAEVVQAACSDLSRGIAADAEGASHLVVIDVEGTRTNAEAKQVAKTIAESALVKTAIYGADPNWGRFVSAAGYSGVLFEERDLTLWMGEMELYRAGTPLPFDPVAASAYLKNNREVSLRLKFTLGEGRCRFFTCDLTTEYVTLNADYTT